MTKSYILIRITQILLINVLRFGAFFHCVWIPACAGKSTEFNVPAKVPLAQPNGAKVLTNSPIREVLRVWLSQNLISADH